MTKFETGKRYKAEASMAVFEVVKRSNKFVTVAFIHHYGRFNEKLAEPKKLKVNVWGDEEVLFSSNYEIHANNEYKGEK